jgi:type III restriction enzyme
VAKGTEFIELRYPGGESFLHIGEAYGDIEPLAIQRQMIKRTIKEHLDKEKRLRPEGIKVLSLFFIDAVDKYTIRRRRQPGEWRLCPHLRRRIPPARQPP